MDISGMFMDKWLGGIKLSVDQTPGYLYKGHWVYRVAYMHDEYVWDCPEEIAPEIAVLGPKSIQKAGEFLKMRVPLTGESKIDKSWARIH